jgi:hypothetical protein
MLSSIISQINSFTPSTTYYASYLATTIATSFKTAFASTIIFFKKYYHSIPEAYLSVPGIKATLISSETTIAALFLTNPMQTMLIICLVYLALKALKTRTKKLAAIFVTPALFSILAINLALKYYALNFLDLFIWICATIIFILIGYLSINPTQIKYDTLNETFKLPGTKFNLALTLLILLANYYLNYKLYTNPSCLYLTILLSINNSLFGLFIGHWLAYVIYTDKLSTD